MKVNLEIAVVWLLYPSKTDVFGGILESACVSVRPCIHPCTKYQFLSKHWQAHLVTALGVSGLKMTVRVTEHSKG